jgi:hypothetical protein
MGSRAPLAGPGPERRTVANSITPLSNNDYQVFPLFSGTDNACTNAIYLLPPSFSYGETINLTVRYLYTGGADYAKYSYDNDDFQFSLVPNQQGGTPQPPYQTSVDVSITLLGNNMWKCSPSARQTLMSNFIDFCTQIESKFEIKTPVLASGSTSIIAGQIAEVIPAALPETLFYRYGLNQGYVGASAPRVDLLPGMRLRVEFEINSFISPGNQFNAYISSGQFYYYISSVALPNNQRVLAFDAFLGNVAAPKILPSPTTTPFLASGIIDMQSVGMARKYYRLRYPQNIISGNTQGDSSQAKNITLMGANTLSELNAGSGTSVINSIFRGRVEIVPEIPVRVGHPASFETIYVPVGTTVNNLLERYTRWKPYYTQQRVVSLSRLQTAAGSQSGNQSLGYTNVDFCLNYFDLPVADLRSFDLPLVHSDNLIFGF